MKFNRTALRCVCVAAAMMGAARGQTQIDLRTQGKNIDFSLAARTRPSKTGTLIPAVCTIGETFVKTDAAAGKNWYVCTAANVWTAQGGEVPDPTGKAYQILTNDGSGSLWQAFGGDLSGRPGTLTVTGLGGRKLGSLTPLDGQFLKWNGVSQQWEPTTMAGAISVFGRAGAITAQTGDYAFGQIAGVVTAAQLPPAGGDLNGTLAGARVTGLQSRPVGTSVPATGQVLAWDGAQWSPQALTGVGVTSLFGRTGAVVGQTGDYSFGQISGTLGSAQLPPAGGDLSGTLTSATVNKLQNRPLSGTAPTSGQVLTWDGAQWTPLAGSGGGSGGGTGGANSVDKTLSNTYTAGAKQIFVPSLATSGINIMPGTLPTNPAAGDVSLDSGDANKLKIYDGGQWNTLVTVSNYVATFTAQTLVTINGTTHRLGTANLSVECYDGASPSARVEPDKIAVAPVTYNVSIYFASAQTGSCMITGSGGVTSSGASGAGMAAQLGDLGLVLTSPTVLTAGLNCSNATPCNTRLGNTVYSVTNSSTITLSVGSGTLYLYVDSSGALAAGHNLTLTCAGVCGAVSGVTAFPVGSIPLFTWTATNGLWDSNGGSDKRAFLSTRSLGGGTGIVALDTGTQTVVAVDSAIVPTYLTVAAVIDFTGIPAGACAESTFTLPGASAGDSVAPGWPAGMESGLIGMMRISGSNTVAVRVCNLSATTVDPAAAAFRATVVRSF